MAVGRWYPSGSSWVENDVNVPSSESNIRQLLMGTQFFLNEFGKDSREFMLPDCFGFPYSLPSILNHCGIRGFSTQKLTWESANGIPFNVGRCIGPDGKWVIAALNAGDYSREHKTVYSTDKTAFERLEKNKQISGLPIDYMYVGGGDKNNADRGGSVQNKSIETLLKIQETQGDVQVVAGKADVMFNAISNEQALKFPVWNSELQLIKHSTGVLSSQAYTKKLNRDAEILGDAAERAAVSATLLVGSRYPKVELNNAWGLMLRNQFHDNLPGTSIPKVYEHSWNDGIIALNQFAGAYQDAIGALAQTLNTDVAGIPVVVFNPLSIARKDIVEAFIPERLANVTFISVFDVKGVEVPSQITIGFDGKRRVLFQAELPSVGASVFSMREVKYQQNNKNLIVKDNYLENDYYQVKIDANGDISSIFDKRINKEILEKSIQLEFGDNFPDTKPAWRIYWKDIIKPTRSVVKNPMSVKIVENGPLRVAIEVVRSNEGSIFKQRIQLSAGADGSRVETLNQIEWKTRGTLLKAAFHFTANAPEATYNLGLGTIKRGNRIEKQYEVSHHSWFDLTDKSEDYGVSVLTGAKYGSDKVDDNTLILTLIHGTDTKESVQEVLDDGPMSEMRWQDWGRHEIKYAIASHKADWRLAKTQWEAMRFEQRPAAFEVPKHKGNVIDPFLTSMVDYQRFGRLLITPEHTIVSMDAKKTIAAIETNKSKRFSIHCSFDPPHPPFLVAAPYYGSLNPANLPFPQNYFVNSSSSIYYYAYELSSPYYGQSITKMGAFQNPATFRIFVARYYEMVKEVDDKLGEILKKLDDTGLTNKTMIVFCGDHGEMLGSHGMNSKNNFYDESARVPLIIRYHAKIAAGKKIQVPVNLIDLRPTIEDYFNFPATKVDGKTLRPFIEDTYNKNETYFAVSEWYSSNVPGFMVRTNNRKLMIAHTAEARNTAIDGFYNLQADSLERINILKLSIIPQVEKTKAQELKVLLVKWLKKVNSPYYYSVKSRPLGRLNAKYTLYQNDIAKIIIPGISNITGLPSGASFRVLTNDTLEITTSTISSTLLNATATISGASSAVSFEVMPAIDYTTSISTSKVVAESGISIIVRADNIEITYQNTYFKNCKAKIFSADGKLVLQSRFQSSTLTFSKNNFLKGNYIIQISNGVNSASKKFLVQ